MLERTVFGVFGLLVCAGCASVPPPQTVSSVDLKQYEGTWYEIARLPAWFQRECVESMATYELLESGGVAVTNECITEAGDRKTATGTAYVVDEASNAKLEVVFDNWFAKLLSPLVKGKYWILYIDPEYQTAIVGTPERKYLWILARTPEIDDEGYEGLVKRSTELGFETDRLIRRQQNNLNKSFQK